MADENKGGAAGNNTPAPERPSWLPEKFWKDGKADYEGFSKSYGEAEKKITELSAQVKKASEPKQDDGLSLGGGGTGSIDDLDVPEIVTKAGLKQEDLEKQYAEKGELSAEQYAAFRKVNPGLGRKIVDTIARGLVAEGAIKTQTLQGIKAEAIKIVGGEQQWDTLRNTARDFVPADEIQDIETRLRDPKRFKGAIRDLMDFHAKSVEAGKSKPIIGGNASSGSSVSRGDFAKLMERAGRGDKAAIDQIRTIPQSTIDSWKEDM